MVSQKKAGAASVEAEVKKQVAEVKAAFNDFDIAEESSRNLHYHAVARLYEYVLFVLAHKSQKDIHFILDAASITRHENERNPVLPFIKLVFGEVKDTGRTKKTLIKKKTKDEAAVYAKTPVLKNEMNKRFNIYASYVRWLMENNVSVEEAAARIKKETLADIAKADREAHPDPKADEKQAFKAKDRG